MERNRFLSHNNSSQINSAILKEQFKDHYIISLCDNSNLAYRGEPVRKYFDQRDWVYLTSEGVSVFPSNIRYAIDSALDMHVPKLYQLAFRGRRINYRGGKGRFDR